MVTLFTKPRPISVVIPRAITSFPRDVIAKSASADAGVDPADHAARVRVPDPQDAVLAVGDEVLTVGCEGDAVDGRVLAIPDRPQPQGGTRRQLVAVPVEPGAGEDGRWPDDWAFSRAGIATAPTAAAIRPIRIRSRQAGDAMRETSGTRPDRRRLR